MENNVTRNFLYNLRKKGYLSEQGMERALHLSNLLANRKTWLLFIDYTCLFLGTALFLSGVIFFFAYNWNSLHKFAKLGILECSVFMCAIFAFYKGLDNIVGKVFLLSACILVGGLLAVYGQIYQTGADAYELFIGWSLLISGWVFISRFGALWFVWLFLINLSLILRYDQVSSYDDVHVLFYTLIAVNSLALGLWEYFALKGVTWLKNRWPAAIICGAIHFLFAALVLSHIFDKKWTMAYLLFPCFLTLFFLFYLKMQKDLFMLTIGCISIINVITGIISENVIRGDDSLILVSIVVLVQTGIAGHWLRKVNSSWKKV